MRSGKGNQEEEDYGEEEFSSKRGAANRDGKDSNDKASAIRSKHSVTEQRRRSKINERFQILRDLIPNSEQKRDTASFLLEVIDYVQYLQDKVQNYQGSWTQEPTKLTPWRNNHWRLPNPPLAINNPAKFEENIVASAPAIVAEIHNPLDSDRGRSTLMDTQPEFDDKGPPFLHAAVQPNNECPATSNDMVVQAGTISISSVYSQELLSSLTLALQNAGVDLSHAKLAVQIELGKRANQGLTHDGPSSKNPLSSDFEIATQPRDPSVEDESGHSHKRVKTL